VNKPQHRSSEDFWLFGIHVARKTDILAFAAFLIALGGIIYQVSGFFRGPVIHVFPPSQILIRRDTLPSGRAPVRFAAIPVAFVNDGDAGYNATIRRELLHYQLPAGTNYTQIWQEFTASDADSKGKLDMHPQGSALPFVVNAGSSVSHETYFTPMPVNPKDNPDEWVNFLEWDKFLSDLEGIKSLTFEVESQIYEHKSVFTSCTVDIDQNVIDRLKRDTWYAPSCWEK
jgi:hypothetical protein